MDKENEFKTVSVDGCDILGMGVYGVVYKIAPDTVVKVYRHDIHL